MRVAIVGSRDYPKLHDVRFYVACLAGRRADGPLVIVSGGARGVDRCAVETAEQLGIDTVEYLPEWDKRRNAAHERNQKIVDNCDLLVAFWDGRSGGTRDVINRALASHRHTEVIFD